MEEAGELEVSWGRAVRVWWALCWRGLIAFAAATIVGFIAGFIVGFVLGFLGVPTSMIPWITGPIGGAIGILFSIVPVKLVLGKDFAEFRLVLLAPRAKN